MITAPEGKWPRSPARPLPTSSYTDPHTRPIRYTTHVTILRLVTLSVGLMTVQCEPQQNSPLNTPVFRPGSGAQVKISGSSAIASSLPSGHSLKDLVSLTGSGPQSTDDTES